MAKTKKAGAKAKGKAGAKAKGKAKAKKPAAKKAAKPAKAAKPKKAAAKPAKAAAKPAKPPAHAAAKRSGAAKVKQALAAAGDKSAKAADKARAKAAAREQYGDEVRATTTLLQTVEIPAPARSVYAAYLDADQHAKITGGAAKVDARVGGKMTAHDGFIIGRFTELTDGSRIVQTWRSSDWPEGYDDSRLELGLTASGSGTRITMVHEGVPTSLAKGLEQGWIDNYWEPMRRYFSGQEPALDDDEDEDLDDDVAAAEADAAADAGDGDEDDDELDDELDDDLDVSAEGGDDEEDAPIKPARSAAGAKRRPSAELDVDPEEIDDGFGEHDGDEDEADDDE